MQILLNVAFAHPIGMNGLQESAIKNFGNNPVRVLGESDPSTPGHELIDKVIDKIPASQIGELLKTLLGRK